VTVADGTGFIIYFVSGCSISIAPAGDLGLPSLVARRYACPDNVVTHLARFVCGIGRLGRITAPNVKHQPSQVTIGPTNTFLTIALTVFMSTVTIDGLWSVLFGQVESITLRRLVAAYDRVLPIAVMPLSAMIGMTAGAGFYFIDTYSLHQSHKFYGESAIQADAPPLVYGTIAYALGGATAGFLAASIWLRSQVSPR
jgi:hypothetical protein